MIAITYYYIVAPVLGRFSHSYRSSKHETIGLTPAELIFGKIS